MLRNLLFGSVLSDATLDTSVLDSARCLISRYVARIIGSRVLLRKAKLYPERVKRAICSLKRKVIDRNEYFLSRLWRAFHSILRDHIKIPVACARYDVPEDEIFLLFDILDGPDYTIVSKSKMKIERMDAYERKVVFRAISSYANTLLNRKIGSPKFIVNSDPGYSVSDLKKEFAEEGRRLFLFYEHIGKPEKVKNYVKRGMHNRCVNFIKYSTSMCRRPIANINDSSREFALTKVSIDASSSPRDRAANHPEMGETELLGEMTKDTRMVRPDVIFEQKMLLRRLRRSLPPDIYKFVKIVVGNKLGTGFSRWMALRHGVSMEGSSDLYKLGEYAMEYLGVDRKDVLRHIIPHLHA